MTQSNLKEKKGEHPFGDAGQMIGAGLFFVVWIVDSFFLHLSTFLSAYLPLWMRLAFLAAILALAIVLFISGHAAVVHAQRPQNVIRTGAFKFVRHPLYLSGLSAYLGLVLSTSSLYSAAVLLVLFLFYDRIATYEEKIMEAKFGHVYSEYKRRTGKWFPRTGGGS